MNGEERLVRFGLHGLELCVTPPLNLPDIFLVLWVIMVCMMIFFMSLAVIGSLYKITLQSCETKKQKSF
jgi:hypothetical protein